MILNAEVDPVAAEVQVDFGIRAVGVPLDVGEAFLQDPNKESSAAVAGGGASRRGFGR